MPKSIIWYIGVETRLRKLEKKNVRIQWIFGVVIEDHIEGKNSWMVEHLQVLNWILLTSTPSDALST